MKLYRCLTPTNRLCACGRAAQALKRAGLEFETERVPVSRRRTKRQHILTLTDQPLVPVLVDDAGQVAFPSQAIIEYAAAVTRP
jgi:glutathione S-transferase